MAGRLAAGSLAARGAGHPAAFAAWLASRAAGGQQQVIGLAGSMDGQLQCPNCGYRSDDADFKISGGTADTSDPAMPDALRTPAPSTGYVRDGVPLEVRGGGSAPGLSNPMELSTPRYPVSGPQDILIVPDPGGGAAVRHRRGGSLIGQVRQGDKGWQAVYGGRDLTPRTQSRAALADLLGVWNRGTTTLQRPADDSLPIQPPPEQTPLMARYGVPAIRALATPATSASSGPRMTAMANGSGDDGDSDDDSGSSGGGGLGPRGQSVYKKLKAKGWPDAKAMKFASMAEKNQGRIGG